jgi:acetyl esterase/lipase
VACGCDPVTWGRRAYAKDHDPRWLASGANLSPLELAPGVPAGTRIRMIVGAEDEVAPLEDSRVYAEALQARGIDARLRVVPGLNHNNIVFRPPVFQELIGLIGDVDGASP